MNFGRGETEEAAVLEALAKNQLKQYITDFPSAGLIGQQSVVLSAYRRQYYQCLGKGGSRSF